MIFDKNVFDNYKGDTHTHTHTHTQYEKVFFMHANGDTHRDSIETFIILVLEMATLTLQEQSFSTWVA